MRGLAHRATSPRLAASSLSNLDGARLGVGNGYCLHANILPSLICLWHLRSTFFEAICLFDYGFGVGIWSWLPYFSHLSSTYLDLRIGGLGRLLGMTALETSTSYALTADAVFANTLTSRRIDILSF